jgi:hypothetical protein
VGTFTQAPYSGHVKTLAGAKPVNVVPAPCKRPEQTLQ